MAKTIFAVEEDIDKLKDYISVLKLKFEDKPYTVETFRSPWKAYHSMVNVRPGPDLLITAFDFDHYPNMGGPKLIREVHKLGSQTKFIMSSGMHASNMIRTIDELKKDGIDVEYIPFYNIEYHLGELVNSLLGE